MSITHEWNGTILTITSDSGTSSADLKGAKGDDGCRGAQGAAGVVDYSLVYTKANPPTAAEVGAITEDELEAALNNVSVDLSEYYTKTETNALIPDTTGLASEDFVNQKIAEAQLGGSGGDIDLSIYYTKTETDNAINDAIGALEETDLSNYYTKAEVDKALEDVEVDIDLTDYYTKAETNAAITDAIGDIEITGGSSKAVAYNLLDNSYFVNPINQRGKTSYTGQVYSIDRWRSWNNSNTTTINNNSVSCSIQLWQEIEPIKIKDNTKYTAAVCLADGAIYCATATIGEVIWNDSVLGNEYVCLNLSGDIRAIHLKAGEYKWAALYEGEYTAETLPEYVYKGYAAELLECQRYFINVAKLCGIAHAYSTTNAYCSIFLPVKMRTKPTISSEKFSYTVGEYSTSYVKINSTSAVALSGNNLSFWGTSSGLTAGKTYLIWADDDAYISADL